MGRCNFSRVGYGMTEREAYIYAIRSAQEERGHEDGYSGDMNSADGPIKAVCIKKPKRAKRGAVEKFPTKGIRKWETVFIIESHDERIYHVVKTTQGDAIKKAKELADEKNVRLNITVAKQCTSEVKIATISPPKHEMGQWRFSGEARN